MLVDVVSPPVDSIEVGEGFIVVPDVDCCCVDTDVVVDISCGYEGSSVVLVLVDLVSPPVVSLEVEAVGVIVICFDTDGCSVDEDAIFVSIFCSGDVLTLVVC